MVRNITSPDWAREDGVKYQYVENISHEEALGVGQDTILNLKDNLGGVQLENYEWSHVASDAGWKKKTSGISLGLFPDSC